jgi:hypothetical protein
MYAVFSVDYKFILSCLVYLPRVLMSRLFCCSMQILHALYLGVNVISTDYPRVLSSVGMAISYHFRPPAANRVTSDPEAVAEHDECRPPTKKQKVLVEGIDDVPLLNLWDTKYQKDTKAVVSSHLSCYVVKQLYFVKVKDKLIVLTSTFGLVLYVCITMCAFFF